MPGESPTFASVPSYARRSRWISDPRVVPPATDVQQDVPTRRAPGAPPALGATTAIASLPAFALATFASPALDMSQSVRRAEHGERAGGGGNRIVAANGMVCRTAAGTVEREDLGFELHDPLSRPNDPGLGDESAPERRSQEPEMHLDRGAELPRVEHAHRGATHGRVDQGEKHCSVRNTIGVEVIPAHVERRP